ncbi:P-loop containing nucleoside triphosphate hydrolase protein [Xylaria sp. FL1042]|nr:P-loop containing nucleoside triphosphate hydrolase protein [Xylaria sp. FL1042]
MSSEKKVEDVGSEMEPKGEAQENQRQKIIRVDQIWDKKTRKYRFVKTAKASNRKQKFSRYVITVARRISTQGTFEGDYAVDIRGQHIQEVLSEAYRDLEDVSFPSVISMDNSELELLFFALPTFREKLAEEKKHESPNQGKVFELEAAVQFVEEHFEPQFTKLNELPDGYIVFEMLWTLFPRNSLVYGVDELGQGRVYRLRYASYGRNQDGSPFFNLKIDYLDTDGKQVGYVYNQDSPIPGFSGLKSIYDLSLFPLICHPNHEDVCEQFITRGEKILRLKGRHLQEYKGHALDEGNKKFNSHGRVMIDPVTLNKSVPNNTIVPVIRTPLIEEKLTPDQKVLLNPLMYGFSLGDKIWGAFAVSKLKEVIWDEKMIELLVLKENRKDFIRALVRYHGQKSEEGGFDDFVRDKGKGLVGLLAGPPGVGKTLTAEAVAEIARRPLYIVSSGELGENSSTLQNRLMRVMELAETWKAVVLLDEADVFLAERGNADLARNAITSIFLRHLEYYQGILLLTTNRLESFDKAFQSRIHFSFKYEVLEIEARLLIWRTFMEKVKATTDVEIRLQEEDMNKLAGLELNGRQIKNIVGMAQAVATEKKEAITLDIVQLAAGFAKISWTETSEPSSQSQV